MGTKKELFRLNRQPLLKVIILTNGIFVAIIHPVDITGGLAVIIKTRIFEVTNHKYRNLSELAQAMGISVSQIYRVRAGQRNINQKFITGAVEAFPQYRLDDLFYLAVESPPGNTDKTIVTTRHHRMVQRYANPKQQILNQTYRFNIHRPALRDRY